MSKKIVYETGTLDNGKHWRYFGESENNERNGLGMQQWPDTTESNLCYLALGKYAGGFVGGFCTLFYTDSVNIYTNMDSRNWSSSGPCVEIYKDKMTFYFTQNDVKKFRSFDFYDGKDIVEVNYFDNKGNVINTEKYRIPFYFKISCDYLFKLNNPSIPHYYADGTSKVCSVNSMSFTNKYFSLKKFNSATQIGLFESEKCNGVGLYHFEKSNDFVLGDFKGVTNNGYVFYTYDSGNSIRYGYLDEKENWQGFVVVLDDEHYISIVEKKNGETVKTYKISDLTLINGDIKKDEAISSEITKGDSEPVDTSKLVDLLKLDTTKSTLTVEQILGGGVEPEPTVSAVTTINDLIGLQSVKDSLKLILNWVLKAKKSNNMKGLKNFSMHMAFLGNPGTGKTQVAKLLAQELHKIGYLAKDHFVEVTRAELVGKYIGESEDIMKRYIQEALGGVLFIDEAYALHVKDSDKDYGKQIIDTLVKAMDEYRGQFVVVLAGYKDETLEMIESNPGLKSRIKNIIDFPDYSREELEKIGYLFLKEYGFEITPEAMKLTSEIVYSKVYEKSFGNARAMRNALETIILYQSQRTVEDNKFKDNLITVEDAQRYAALEKYEITEKGQDIMGSSFDNLVGLKSVKKMLKLIEAHVNKNRGSISSTHMIFYGNPGTGKTTVARLMGKMLYRAGLLPTDKLTEVKRADLVAEYIGQTAIKTNQVIRKALGGVLFIDEAYSLTESESEGHRSFGAEALTALITAMEEHRDKLCIIFAGYKKEMSDFLRANSGIHSRIFFHVDFEDYDEDELAELTKLALDSHNYWADETTIRAISKLALTLKGTRSFANARTVRNFVSKLVMIQSARTSDVNDRQVTMEDVKVLAEDSGLSLTAIEKIEYEIPTYERLKQLSDDWDSANFVYNKQDTDERVVHLTTTRTDGMSEGSGFIITPDGYYLTCNHCIEGATDIKTRVTYYNRHGKRIYAEYDTVVVAASKEHDCALCKMNGIDSELPYMPLSFEPIDTLKDNAVVLAGYPHGLRRVNEISFFEGKIISQQHAEGDDKIYTDIMGKSGCSGSAVFYKDTGKVVGVFCGAMLSHNNNFTEEMNYLKPISHSIDLLKK